MPHVKTITDQFRAIATTSSLERQFSMMLRACLKAGLSHAFMMSEIQNVVAESELLKRPKTRKQGFGHGSPDARRSLPMKKKKR